MNKGERLLGVRVDNLRHLHQVDANQLLEGEDGREVVGRIIQKQEPDIGVRDKECFEMGNNERGKEIRVGKGIDASLICQRLSCERLHRVGDQVAVSRSVSVLLAERAHGIPEVQTARSADLSSLGSQLFKLRGDT